MARETSERELVSAMWRLAGQAEQRGVRIVTERASGEVFATSASDPTTIYKVTGFSCTCTGYFHYQRCQHNSLLLRTLGWLPDPDPEPAPPTPLAIVPEPAGDPCLDCRSLGSVMRLGESGAWFEVACEACGGTGRVALPGEAVATAVATASRVSTDAGEGVTVAGTPEVMGAETVVAIDVVGAITGVGGADRPSDLPDPWDAVPVAVPTIPDAAPPVAVEVVAEADPAVPSAPVPFVRREDRARALEATVEEAIASLAGQLARGHTAGYLETLDFYSRFHRYSVPNTILIKSQRPEARLVAGLKKWNALGYWVRAGERAVWVWAPLTRKSVDEATGEMVEQVVGFRPAPVFADSQLVIPEDQPLPSLFRPLPDDCEELYRAARERVIGTGIAVEEVALPGGIQGASLGGKILVRTGLDSRSRLLVLAHELGHELAHQGLEGEEKPRQIRELEAESTAFVVGRILGVDNPFSADYLINYGLDTAALQAALGTIQRLVRRVIAIISPEQVQTQEVRRAA